MGQRLTYLSTRDPRASAMETPFRRSRVFAGDFRPDLLASFIRPLDVRQITYRRQSFDRNRRMTSFSHESLLRTLIRCHKTISRSMTSHSEQIPRYEGDILPTVSCPRPYNPAYLYNSPMPTLMLYGKRQANSNPNEDYSTDRLEPEQSEGVSRPRIRPKKRLATCETQ